MRTIAIGLLVLLSGCSGTNADAVALDGMLSCREKFHAAFKTLSAASSSLPVEKRYEVLVNAVFDRDKCEAEAVNRARK